MDNFTSVLGVAERNLETSCEGKARANKLTSSPEVALRQPERPSAVAPIPNKSERRFTKFNETPRQTRKISFYEDTAPDFSYGNLLLNSLA